MTATRRRAKRNAAKAAKRREPHRGKGRFITRAEARRQAARHLAKGMFKGATVRDGATARLNIYFQGRRTVKDAWVVFKNREDGALRSAEVVLVSKRTGRVLYEGPAHDEG
jgi:hypothetical protein